MNGAPFGNLLVKPVLILLAMGAVIGGSIALLASVTTHEDGAQPKPITRTECRPIRILRDGTFYGWQCENSTITEQTFRPDPAKLEKWLGDKCKEGSAEFAEWRDWGADAERACRDENYADCPFDVCAQKEPAP